MQTIRRIIIEKSVSKGTGLYSGRRLKEKGIRKGIGNHFLKGDLKK